MKSDVGSGADGDAFEGVLTLARSGRIVVVLYRVVADADGDRLVAYVFGATRPGLIDLIGMHVETAAGATPEAIFKRAHELGRGLALEVPTRGLRAREVRAAVAQHGLIERAMHYIEELATSPERDIREGFAGLLGADQVRLSRARDTRLSDEFLACFVVDYAAALAAGETRAEVGARQDPPVSAKAIEAWVRKATDRRLWIKAGQPGKVGQPSVRAHQLAGTDGV